jgi:hypothetical protein
MNASFIFEMAVGILRGFLTNSAKAAQYAKWLLRIRDYLLLLFPVDTYPQNETADSILNAIKKVKPVPVEAVKSASAQNGFNIPFIKGM